MTSDDHLCQCGKWGVFGFKNPDSGDYDWFCGEHCKNGGQGRMVDAAEAQSSFDLGLQSVDRRASWDRYLKGGFDWETKFAAYVRFAVPPGAEGLSEVWRIEAERLIGPPPNDHVVGSVILRAAKQGLIKETGRLLAPRDKKSHTSKKREWRRTTMI
jgi:hypothetical protein